MLQNLNTIPVSFSGTPVLQSIHLGTHYVGIIAKVEDSIPELDGWFLYDVMAQRDINQKPCTSLNQAKALAESYYRLEVQS